MDTTTATPAERQAAIVQILNDESSVQVADLSRRFGVSKVTVRSDLESLERAGRLRRTHGGAVSLSQSVTVNEQDLRINVNVQEKRAIARAAVNLIKEGDSILLDSGTTSLELARSLAGISGLTVVTNDLTIANFVDRSLRGTSVIMLGGVVNKGHRYTSGPLTLAALETLRPSLAFVCPTSFAPGRGLMANNQDMAQLKKVFLTCAERCCVLLGSSKVGAGGLLRFGELTQASVVVVDKDPDGQVAAALEGSAAELLMANEG